MEAVRRETDVAFGPAIPDARHRARERCGILFAIVCAMNGAFVPAVANVTTRGSDPFAVTVVTTWFAAAAALVVLVLRGRLHALLSPAYALRLASLGALGTGLAFTLFFAGAARSTAVDTVLCLQIEPVYSLLLSWWVLQHAPTVERVAATLLILVGLAIALGLEAWTGGGTWYLLATPLCWQLSHLIVLRGLPGVPTEVLAGARYVWGAVVLTVTQAFLYGGPGLPVATSGFPWAWVALQGLVLSYGGTVLWYAAVTRIDLARATVLVVPTVPVLSLGASFLLLGEVPSWRQALGLLIAAAGVYVFARRGVG